MVKNSIKVHPTTKYAQEVVSGKRIVGRSEFLACQRHLTDLSRQGKSGFHWIFDESKADKIFHFFLYLRHIKGKQLVGQPIKLEPFQRFDLGCMLGWVHRDTGFRRFEKAYIQEGRGNGKSTECGGLALYLLVGEKEEEPEVYCAANDKQQSRIVYNIAKKMAEKSPDIRKRLVIRNYQISHIDRGGELIPFSRETQNKDGYHPSGAIIDEYHAHRTSEIYDLIWSGWGQRNQGLLIVITTAGMNAENNPCFTEYKFCKQILKTPSLNERYFVMIRELDPDDDEHDPKNWIKANPLRASTREGRSDLKSMHDEAFRSKDATKIRTFRIKNLNKWVYESENSYIGDYIEKWDECAVSRLEFKKLTRGWTCLVGLDLAKSIDLTADGFLFLAPNGWIAVMAQGFMPQEALIRHEKTDRIPYQDWAKEGWLTVNDGPVVDYNNIQEHFESLAAECEWRILEVDYDPYNATHFINGLITKGYTCVEIQQIMRVLSGGTKLFREMIAAGEVIHDGSPLLRQCLVNAREIQDTNENIKILKKSKDDTQRIDLVATLINCMVRFLALKELKPEDLSAKILSPEWGM